MQKGKKQQNKARRIPPKTAASGLCSHVWTLTPVCFDSRCASGNQQTRSFYATNLTQ